MSNKIAIDNPDHHSLIAVAISQLKESRRFQATQIVAETLSYEQIIPELSRGDLEAAQNILERCHQLNLAVLPLTSNLYPERLSEINAPPIVLYAQSLTPIAALPSQIVGVVGTRSASIDTCQRAADIAADLAHAGVTAVSGLALGIDGAAHRGALRSKQACPTIAVLAHGLDRVYPPSHLGLASEIVRAGGIILSEYAPGVEPLKHHFLARNRIIAGLSSGVLVVQAGARSGSLVTANFAADYGRDVFVLEDKQGSEQSSGGAALIDQGAIAINSAKDILRECGIKTLDEGLSDESSWITTSLETFKSVTNLGTGDLLKLELSGALIHLPGNQVRVRNFA